MDTRKEMTSEEKEQETKRMEKRNKNITFGRVPRHLGSSNLAASSGASCLFGCIQD
jgi:hypothetical protein